MPDLLDSPPRAHPLRVLVADDHEPFRHAIAEVIDAQPEMEVVAEARDGTQAVLLAENLWPMRLDLVLMDIEMPRLDGIAATERIYAAQPDLPIVMLTVSTLDRHLFEAIRAGAVGYLSKDLSSAALVRTLRDFHRDGALPMSRVMARKVLAEFQLSGGSPRGTGLSGAANGLSPRERDVLELIARGARDRDIGRQLLIAERTVKKHVENILRKLHARNRAEAAARLHQFG